MRTLSSVGARLRAIIALALPLLVVLSAQPALAQFAQQGNKMVPSSPTGNSEFGQSVAVSSNGIAVIGGFADNSAAGAAWVFKGSATTFTDIQLDTGVKLVGTGAVGASQQGFSVAISSDGSTIAVGGNADDSGKGAVWIFVDDGNGGWAQQDKLTVSSTSGLGAAVALSADGNTLVAGAPGDLDINSLNVGAAFIFTRSGTTWSQQQKLVGTGNTTGAQQGAAVAIAGVDGNRVIVGGYGDHSGDGGVWFFSRSGTTWSQVGGRVITSDAGSNGNFGWSVAMSFFGTTAAVGAPSTGPGISGASWVYTFDGTNWNQQGLKLVGTNSAGGGSQGHGVALSSTGDTLVVGGPSDASSTGAVWVFNRHAGVWSQQGDKLAPSDGQTNPQMGWSIAVTGSGNTFVSGGIFDFGDLGAAWVFHQTPTFASIAPDHGLSAGGTATTIRGTGFTGAVDVTFGGSSTTQLEVVDPTTINATTPGHFVGTVDVEIVSFEGNVTGTNAFTFDPPLPTISSVSPNSGPVAGGTSVTITGSHYIAVSAVKFGTTAAATFSVDNDTQITATTPAHAAGAAGVSVTTPSGTRTKANAFSFLAVPAVTGLNPNTDYVTGGGSVVIAGTDFLGATKVRFGGAAASFTVNSATKITAIAPAHAAGVANVVVTTPGGASATGVAGKFTYLPLATKTTLAKFKGGNKDGQTPVGWLIMDGAGNLYGVTSAGGPGNHGTIFMLAPPVPPATVWKKTIIHFFAGQPADGTSPSYGLVADKSGALYGTTPAGGAHGVGTVYRLIPPTASAHSRARSTYQVLYSFRTSNDGTSPAGGVVIDKTGAVVGTTFAGGSSNNGMLFKLTPATNTPWVRTDLHDFAGATKDAAAPQPRLIIDKAGAVFGTSDLGGASNSGTAFSFTPPTGNAQVKPALLYNFKGGNDGEIPSPGVTAGANGVLYGTTKAGGLSHGTVFQLTPPVAPATKWTEKLLHKFGGANDGTVPNGLTLRNGALYGTTTLGGLNNSGTLFRLSPPTGGQTDWTERILHTFNGGSDGARPDSDVLIDANGKIYGLTQQGGDACNCGTVFMIQQ
jgi:uncharacterized repeat protein (TIGR03803 family)